MRTKLFKKTAALALVLALSLSALAGCGTSSSNSAGGNEQAISNNEREEENNEQATDSNEQTEENNEQATDSNEQGPDSNDNGVTTMTLKEFLDSGPRVGIRYDGPTIEDGQIGYALLFENGRIYVSCFKASSEEPAPYMYNDRRPLTTYDLYDDTITWGELGKMSDEELLSFVREHITDEWITFGNNSIYKSDDSPYALHIYTESYNEYKEPGESIQSNFYYTDDGKKSEVPFSAMFRISDTFNSIEQKTVCDANYSSLFTRYRRDGFYFRTNDIILTFDNIGDEGIEVD